jgi:hypothetical protein
MGLLWGVKSGGFKKSDFRDLQKFQKTKCFKSYFLKYDLLLFTSNLSIAYRSIVLGIAL